MDATHRISKNLGGDRLGSGNKMNINLHAYNRSTHDLSRAWRSSMNVGTLVPFFSEIGLPGDTWTINLESLVRTIPAIGPLYGSYKMQLDMFVCPIRLYNGLLHNNMTKIGMNMAQVKLPKININHKFKNPLTNNYEWNNSQIASDSLLNYLGIKGIGDIDNWVGITEYELKRKFNATNILAYYDIYKNYYANKQEEKGYFIKPNPIANIGAMLQLHEAILRDTPSGNITLWEQWHDFQSGDNSALPAGVTIQGNTYQQISGGIELDTNKTYELTMSAATDTLTLEVIIDNAGVSSAQDLATIFPNWTITEENNMLELGSPDANWAGTTLLGIGFTAEGFYTNEINVEGFDLQNIDDARIAILQNTGLNNELQINSLNYEPYATLCKQDGDGQTYNKYHQCGLAIKTYQSDILNAWLKTEWIDGPNGIESITAIDTSSGSFTIDALNLANKVYNMLNRIAVSGGSYEDYIEAVYSTTAMRRAESPIYVGGMSTEIVFEEIVSQTPTEQAPLGTMAGRGTMSNKRGGHVEIKIDEPSYIIGLCSITPRVDYSQGNKWDMTELDTLDDLHKPALDGIGFQDLLQERAAWWGTMFDRLNGEWVKMAMGKSPAWIDYMTATNETHGTFAEEGKTMYMTLNRRYEYKPRKPFYDGINHGIWDLTTYVNPTKYNYSFADTSLAAQNFWVQIGMQVIARRVMSAKIIPNL